MGRDAAGGLAKEGDALGIAAESGDVLLHPPACNEEWRIFDITVFLRKKKFTYLSARTWSFMPWLPET